MTRKVISAFLVLLLCVSMALSVSAESKAIDFVVDEIGYLEDGEVAQLNDQARLIYEKTGVGVFFLYIQADSVEEFDVSQMVNGISDYVCMVENETHWYIHLGGKGTVLDITAEDALRDAYDGTETYAEGVAVFLNEAAAYFPQMEESAEAVLPDEKRDVLFDEADLLTEGEEAALRQKLTDISRTYQAELVIATVGAIDGGDIDGFVESVYDNMGFGYGENRDGVLLLVCMDPREFRILSNGFAGNAISMDGIEDITAMITPNLSEGDYAGAFDEFVVQCAYYLNGFLNGFPFDAKDALATAILVGLGAGLITAFVLKGQLKTVHKQNQANVYVRQGSMQVKVERDLFLYRNITRTKKESSSSKNSDSGSSRNVGGGSF